MGSPADRLVRAKRRLIIRRPTDGVFKEDSKNPGVFTNGRISIRIKFDPDVKVMYNMVQDSKSQRAGAARYLVASSVGPEAKLESTRVTENLKKLGDKQVELYKPLVMNRVADRFADPQGAEEWFATGRVPGFGNKTPEQLVRAGHADWVIEAVDAANAGVYG